jgi:hypothetical protein
MNVFTFLLSVLTDTLWLIAGVVVGAAVSFWFRTRL